MPASLPTIGRFLVDCPAADSTQRRRIRDIVAAHRDRGIDLRSRSPWLPEPAAQGGWAVTEAAAPSDYRDRALLAAVCAGVTVSAAVTATAGQLLLAVPRAHDPGACGRCAVKAWSRLLRADQTGGRRALSDAVDDLNHARAQGHLCEHLEDPPDGPLIRSVDRHGWIGRDRLTARAAWMALRRLRAADSPDGVADDPPPPHVMRDSVDPAWSDDVERMLDDLEPALDDALDAVQRMLDAAVSDLASLLELRHPTAP